MNLQTHIHSELWLAIQSTYESENYSHAVLDAMHYLTDVIRDKSGIDGDGVSLVGQALGGDSPRLRVTKLQTQTERDIQHGLQEILRGMYRAIRNPRAHEQVEDSKKTADAIIYFLDHLLSILAEPKPPFTMDEFLTRVFDPDFVASNRYAELLAAEIPANRRVDTLIEMYRRKHSGNSDKQSYMVRTVLEQLPQDQIAEYLTVVSDELLTTRAEKDVEVTIKILPPDLWPDIEEAARLRVEHKLIRSIRQGELDPFTDGVHVDKGAFGIWARGLLPYFTSKDAACSALIDRLNHDTWSRAYVVLYFTTLLSSVCETTSKRNRCIYALCKAVKQGERLVRNALTNHWLELPDDWRHAILSSLKNLKESDPAFYTTLVRLEETGVPS